jgi:hypothetical protein
MAEDKKKLEKEAIERINSEMMADERYIKYFEAYTEHSVAAFIKKYADARATLEVYGDFTKYRQENIIKDYHEGAWNALKEIQHKKLFDLECQWRAEQVTNLPGVLVSKDFYDIAKNVLLYDGIPEVTEEDIALYQDFLSQKPGQIVYTLSYVYYPDYEQIKNQYHGFSVAGYDYFDFHNNVTGSQSLLQLPDVRGMKETKYMDAARDFNIAKVKAKINSNSTQKNEKKYLSSTDKELIRFGEHFGDKKTINFIIDRWNWIKEKPDMIFSWAFEYLRDIAPEKVSIGASDDWKEALYFAAIGHRNENISDLLPSVYEEYLLKKEMGLLHPEKENDPSRLSVIWKEHILKGRELLGEPRDFDY